MPPCRPLPCGVLGGGRGWWQGGGDLGLRGGGQGWGPAQPQVIFGALVFSFVKCVPSPHPALLAGS